MFEAASLPIIGLDIAKSVFQVYQVDSQAGEIRRHQVRPLMATQIPPSMATSNSPT